MIHALDTAIIRHDQIGIVFTNIRASRNLEWLDRQNATAINLPSMRLATTHLAALPHARVQPKRADIALTNNEICRPRISWPSLAAQALFDGGVG
jgi:hypothetical protein